MAAIISDSTGDGRFPVKGDSFGKDKLASAFASSVSNPVITPSMLRKQAALGTNEHESEDRAAKISLNPVTSEVVRKEQAPPENANPHAMDPLLMSEKTDTTKLSNKKYSISDIDELVAKKEAITGIDPAIFLDENAHPLALLAAGLFWFGDSFLEWEPETVWHEISEKGVKSEIPRCIKDKAMAIRAAHRIDNFYYSFQDFEILVNALNHKIVNFYNFSPPEIPEIANAVSILSMVRTDGSYNDEIKFYIHVIAKNTGWVILPECLSFANEDNDNMLFSDAKDRAAELLIDSSNFNISSVIDGQASRLAVYMKYAEEQDKLFSDNINQYFFFRQGQ